MIGDSSAFSSVDTFQEAAVLLLWLDHGLVCTSL